MKYLAIRTIAVLVTSYFTKVGVPLVFSTVALSLKTTWIALLAAVVIAIINHTVKPLFMIISIPINIVTLGLFSFVINGLMIMLAARIVPDFAVPSLLMAIYFSIVLAIVNWVLHFVD
jgi:putative membrane protein